MVDITIKLAEQKDVPAVREIMAAARGAMARPEDYITDPEDYVRAHVSEKGFLILGLADGVTAGFFMVVKPEFVLENTGYELDFPPEVLAVTAILDSVAVHPDFQGHGLMERMLQAALERLSDCRYFVATVAPDNLVSLHNFEKCGFRPLKLIHKPGGQERYLMGKGF